MTPTEMLAEFYAKSGPRHSLALRRKLYEDEHRELLDALDGDHRAEGDLVGIAHELADVVYTAHGIAEWFGLDLDKIVAAIHAANMAKLNTPGGPVYDRDGKVLKPPGWEPANIAAIITGQEATT